MQTIHCIWLWLWFPWTLITLYCILSYMNRRRYYAIIPNTTNRSFSSLRKWRFDIFMSYLSFYFVRGFFFFLLLRLRSMRLSESRSFLQACVTIHQYVCNLTIVSKQTAGKKINRCSFEQSIIKRGRIQ